MKGQDLQTLKILLSEYGMKPGVSTSVGDQQSGQQAKQNKAKSVTAPSKSNITKPSPSPTVLGSKPESEEEPVEPTMAAAKDVEKGSQTKDDQGQELEIIGSVGNKSNPDTIVAKNKKGEYVTVEPDSELEVTESSEDKLDKMLKRKNKLRQKIKRVLRAQKHAVQGEPVFEINFNSKDIITSALNAPIQCGFEAETTWPNLMGGIEGFNWDYADWDMIRDVAYDQGFSRELDQMSNAYNDWLSEEHTSTYEYELTRELVAERREDEDYIDRYVNERVYDEDVEDYKEQRLDFFRDRRDAMNNNADQEEQDPDGSSKVVDRYRAKAESYQQELDEYEEWDYDAWAREYVEQELS